MQESRRSTSRPPTASSTSSTACSSPRCSTSSRTRLIPSGRGGGLAPILLLERQHTMATHRLSAGQVIARPLDEVFEFFSRPGNLGRITPGSMGFDQQSTDREMRSGLEIEYRIRPLLGIPVTWRSRIEAFDAPRSFEDVQLSGPYRTWRHRHTFTAVEGGTLVEDDVTYELPLGRLGELAHRLVVRGELQRIFRFRSHAIARILEAPGETFSPLTVAVAGATGFVGGA